MRSSIILVFLVACLSSCGTRPSSNLQLDDTEVRRYFVADIFVSGGKTTEQLKLYEAYQNALAESKASGNIQTFPLFKRTFQLVGVSFPKGTTVIFSPRDSHLWIRHDKATLDQLEKRFQFAPPRR